jgi:hypothetical protein
MFLEFCQAKNLIEILELWNFYMFLKAY